jgi:Ig-like domain from next to BRCA1 gene
MQKFSTVLAGIVIIAAVLACNLPSSQQVPPAIMTSAALTVQAQLSPTSPPLSTATVTNTPVPFPTLPLSTLPPPVTPTSSCDNAHFVTDVTYPDNTAVSAGDNFTKTWRFQNYGTCSWTPSYALVFMSGESMSGPSTQALTGNINPGQTVDISVNLTAPSSSGTHVGYWGLRNASGVIFAHFYVQIKVGSSGGGTFAVTHVTYDLSTFNDGGNTGCPMVTAHITANMTGDVQYHWVRSDGPESVQTLHFSSSSTQDVQEKWYLGSGATGTQWLGIYIDAPNHQDFGHININKCITP